MKFLSLLTLFALLISIFTAIALQPADASDSSEATKPRDYSSLLPLAIIIGANVAFILKKEKGVENGQTS